MGGKPSDDAPIISPISSNKSGGESEKMQSKDVTQQAINSETTSKAVKVRPIGFDALARSNESPIQKSTECGLRKQSSRIDGGMIRDSLTAQLSTINSAAQSKRNPLSHGPITSARATPLQVTQIREKNLVPQTQVRLQSYQLACKLKPRRSDDDNSMNLESPSKPEILNSQ